MDETERPRPAADYWRTLRRQKDEVMSVRAALERRQGRLAAVLDRVARLLAHPAFYAVELLFHGAWIALNVGVASGVRPWDPYPFPLLAGLASVQALFIALLILMHGRRQAHVAELREEVGLQVSLHAEREASKLLRLMEEVHRALALDDVARDAELQEMQRPLDPDRLRDSMEDTLRRTERKSGG